MKKIYRASALIALLLLALSAACSPREVGLTSAEATALANGATGLPPTVTTLVAGVAGTGTPLASAASPAANQTQSVPVTGAGAPTQLCQFCMDGVAHAIVSIPDTASFNVGTAADGSPAATCNSVETLNGKQLVLCYATNPASFHLNVCPSNGACSDFVVNLQACPNLQAAPTNKKPNPTEPPLTTPTVGPTEVIPTDTPPVETVVPTDTSTP